MKRPKLPTKRCTRRRKFGSVDGGVMGDKEKAANVNKVIDEKCNLQPVVRLLRVSNEHRKTSVQNADSVTVNKEPNLNPVVFLDNILDKVRFATPSTASVQKISRSEGENPVVLLTDCLGVLHQHGGLKPQLQERQRNRKIKTVTNRLVSGLEKRGLQDFKLGQVKMKQLKLMLNIPVITQLMVDAVSIGNAPSRHNRPFDLGNPEEECYAIVEALSIYAHLVPANECLHLFYSSPHSATVETANCNVGIHRINEKKRKMMVKRREVKEKGWIYVTSLSSSDFFAKMNLIPEKKYAFEKKMLSIMKAGTTVDPHNWTLSEVGYILGFWLAKLYNNKGIADENLPRELTLAKEHFLELHGFNYDAAILPKY